MKRRLALLLGLSPLAIAGMAMGEIVGSRHDFSLNGNAAWSGGEICKPCHTPHHGAPESISGRMWNHQVTVATYDVVNVTVPTGGTKEAAKLLDGKSRLCMSCHDGTVALDSFGGASGSTFAAGRTDLSKGTTLNPDGSFALDSSSKNLQNDHPVGNYTTYDITSTSYNATVAGSKGAARMVITSGGGELRLYKKYDAVTGLEIVDKYIVSCYTCHDPHNGYNSAERYLLRSTNQASELCLGCHNK